MAVSSGGKLNFLSLTGQLNLLQKGLFKAQYKSYWFWFDEQTCCLKYYRSQQTYSQSVREPLGVIDLRYAKVTPALTTSASESKLASAVSRSKESNVFHIRVDNQVHVLAATDNEEAIHWIEKLQEKRSEFIKSTSAQLEANQELDKRRTLSMLTKPVGALADGNSNQDVVEDASPSVRKIFTSHLQGDKAGRVGVGMHLDCLRQSSSQTESARRSTVGYSPLTPTIFDISPVNSENPVTVDDQDSSQQTILDPQERARLALEACYLETENKATSLQKENNQLKEQLQNREKEINELNKEIATLREELALRKAPRTDLQMENENLKNIIEQYKRSLKSLDDEIEVHKLNQEAHEKRVQAEKQKSADLERELNFIKSKYVSLLSEQFKITVPGGGGRRSGDEASENKYNKELLVLLKQEGGESSVFESYCSTFEDQYGDRYDWESDTATQHYLCRLLFAHYTHHDQERLLLEWEDYLSQLKPVKGARDLLQLGGDKTKLRNLLRKGLPLEVRSHVWACLVHHSIGKLKEVRDRATGRGQTYYQSLLKNAFSSPSVKQIKLDLYRTLPNNRHFKSGGAGADKLERILLAYSLHNGQIGYCQGMNMIAAFGLLFLDEETTFWFLVMILEKLMPASYYTPGLLGAQADLAVVSRLLAEKLPHINAHLQEYFIDVTLVTFNWFLTIFIDALPTESALRILDCFLFEGHKLLFRIALAILKVNEQLILSMSDPVGLFQFLKEVARHTFNVEELFNAAFVHLNPFPRRSQLVNWHGAGFAAAKEQWNKREKQRLESEKEQQQSVNVLTSIVPVSQGEAAPAARHLHWECGCLRGRREAWLCCDEKGQGRLGVITFDDTAKPRIEITSIKVSPRVITLYHETSSDLLILGTLDFVLQVIDCKTRDIIWTHKYKDSILDIVGTESGNIIVSLADGNISMMKHVSQSYIDDDFWQLHIGSNSVTTMVISSEEAVWCGAGRTIMIVSTETFEPIHSMLVSGKVNKMRTSPQGVWVSCRSSTTLSLYDSFVYVKLMEVDYTTLAPSPPISEQTDSTMSSLRVTSLMAEEDMVYIGTGGGSVFQLRAVASVGDPEASIRALVAERGRLKSRKRRTEGEVGGGLLTKAALLGQEKEPPSEASLDSNVSYYSVRNRRTQFGRTLRHGRSEGDATGMNLVSVYKLEYITHKQLGSGVNEPVRVILSIGKQILTCVNRVADWDKCVGILCYKEQVDTAQSEVWSVEFIPSPRQASPQQGRGSLSPSEDQHRTLTSSAVC